MAVQPPQPYATRKMEQTKSLGSITDEDSDYTYVDRDVARSKSPSMTQPQAKPFDSIIDEDFDHTYVVPDIFQSKSPSMTQPRARPPRPPPPRRAESPNKPPVMQRTVAPSSPLEKKSIPLGQRYSVPVALPPTPKQRATNQWYKDKH